MGQRQTHEKHGMAYTSEYATWEGMVQRCTNPNNTAYVNYGDRGITVCSKWQESFIAFFKDMGERPKGLTLERMNNNLGYFKDNCKWATKTEQMRNCRISKNNKTGVNGVYWRSSSGKYCARIRVVYTTVYLGCFKTIEEAAAARKEGEIKYWK